MRSTNAVIRASFRARRPRVRRHPDDARDGGFGCGGGRVVLHFDHRVLGAFRNEAVLRAHHVDGHAERRARPHGSPDSAPVASIGGAPAGRPCARAPPVPGAVCRGPRRYRWSSSRGTPCAPRPRAGAAGAGSLRAGAKRCQHLGDVMQRHRRLAPGTRCSRVRLRIEQQIARAIRGGVHAVEGRPQHVVQQRRQLLAGTGSRRTLTTRRRLPIRSWPDASAARLKCTSSRLHQCDCR